MLIAANQLTKFYGKQDLIRRASLHINRGERIGLVGPNGSGKTTLLKMLLGQVEPDEGEIHVARHIRIGYLPQDLLSFKGKTIMEQVLDVAEEVRWIEKEISALQEEMEKDSGADGEEMALRLSQLMDRFQNLGGYDLQPRAEKILAGLGFEQADFSRPTETLSGGWMMRLALARVLLINPDLLLLDEPTNHLDLDALRWLEDFLMQMEASLLIISHDRTLLNKVVTRILELEEGELTSYSGNFDFYSKEKQGRLEQRWALYRAQQEQLRQVQRFIERNRARKDRARQVQSRIKSVRKMELIEPPRMTSQIKFRFPPSPPSARIVAELEKISLNFGERLVFREASLVLERGVKLAVVGPNGSGKTTLLKILAGELAPSNGIRRIGHGVRIVHFSQHHMDKLHPEKTVLEELQDSCSHPHQGELRDLLGAFQFRGDAVFKRVSVLSGGERSRLLLCKLLLAEANVLLLDEPTNHLDITSREVLERALVEFKGAICLVTHDRELMNRVTNQTLVVRCQGWEVFLGNYQEYLGSEAKTSEESTTAQLFPKTGRSSRRDKEQRRLEAEWRNKFSKMRSPIQSEIQALEKQVEIATKRLDEIQEQMGNPELYRFGDQAKQMQQEFQSLRAQIRQWTQRWEQLHLELEEIEDRMIRERPQAKTGL